MPMRPSHSSLYLSLLVSLWTSAAAAFEGPAVEVPLGVLPGSISTILVGPEAFQGLCRASEPDGEVDAEIITGKCYAKTLNSPPPPKMMETTCGVWEASTATVGRPIVRPGTELILRQAADDPHRGFFAGAFDLNTRVRFTHLETGRTVDVKVRFGFRLDGPWVLADPDEPLTTENLILLADRDWEGQIVAHERWVDLEGEEPEEDCPILVYPILSKVPVYLSEAAP